MIGITDMAIIVASYVLGCFCTAYYYAKIVSREDIRELGSGNAGAKNLGRTQGKRAFVFAFLGDFLKGAVAVFVAKYFGFSTSVVALVLVAVVAGHILPFQLGFRGGKGLATCLAGLLVFDFRIALVLLAITAQVMLMSRNDHLSVSAAILFAPFTAFFFGYSIATVVIFALITALILFSHRNDLQKTLLSNQVTP